MIPYVVVPIQKFKKSKSQQAPGGGEGVTLLSQPDRLGWSIDENAALVLYRP